VTAVVTLYGREDCHLCEQAREAILSLRSSGLDFRLQEVDIESDPGLRAEYLERIPVIEVDGETVSELSPDVSALGARLDTVSP
jgi:hypothetical protein